MSSKKANNEGGTVIKQELGCICDPDVSLTPENREKLALNWQGLSEKYNQLGIPHLVDKFKKAAAAIQESNSALISDIHLTAFLDDTRYEHDVAEAVWQLSRWALELENNENNRGRFYFGAHCISEAENAPPILQLAAKKHLLEVFDRVALDDSSLRGISVSSFLYTYKNCNFTQPELARAEEKLLFVINEIMNKRDTGSSNRKDDAILLEIIDTAMFRAGKSPFLQRAHEIRETEIEKIHAERGNVFFGHAPNLLGCLDKN